MKNLFLSALLLTLTASPAFSYDATYNFDEFLTAEQHATLKQIEQKLHRTYDGKIPPTALQNAGLQMLSTMKIFQKIQAGHMAAACNNDLLRYCRSLPQTSIAMKQCVERKKAVISPRCDATLKATLGETLQKNAIINRVSLPQGTQLAHQFAENNKTTISSISTEAPISDHGARFATGIIGLSAQGISKGALFKDATVQGVPLKATSRATEFYANGTLKNGILARDFTYQDITFKAGSTLLMHNNRSVRSGVLASDHTISGIPIKAGKRIFFTKDGQLASD